MSDEILRALLNPKSQAESTAIETGLAQLKGQLINEGHRIRSLRWLVARVFMGGTCLAILSILFWFSVVRMDIWIFIPFGILALYCSWFLDAYVHYGVQHSTLRRFAIPALLAPTYFISMRADKMLASTCLVLLGFGLFYAVINVRTLLDRRFTTHANMLYAAQRSYEKGAFETVLLRISASLRMARP